MDATVLIPIYNDWDSVTELLLQLDSAILLEHHTYQRGLKCTP